MMPEETSSRAAVMFGSVHRNTPPRPDGALRTRVRSLNDDLADMLHADPDVLLPDTPESEFTPERLSWLAKHCVGRAQLLSGYDEDGARQMYLLALDLQQAALELQQHELGMRTRRLESCSDGLTRLRSVPTSGDLLDSVCRELVNKCNFGRAVLSRVDNGQWIPSTAYFGAADISWFAEWVDQGIPLRGNTPETRLLTERRPAVVYDTSSGAVHREIIVESGQSKSYVVAPLMSGGNVVGFLHADHFPTSEQADEADRDVLWAFAEGFSRVHERTVLMERVQAQKSQVENVLGTALRTMDHNSDAGTSLPGSRVATRDDVLAELTTREVEVLHLMVEGATNRSIGARLVITEDTVKSHVKQILRKLGVANRAHAIALVAGTTV
jgi:DNA-binding CsgD family transcriptional regulator